MWRREKAKHRDTYNKVYRWCWWDGWCEGQGVGVLALGVGGSAGVVGEVSFSHPPHFQNTHPLHHTIHCLVQANVSHIIIT